MRCRMMGAALCERDRQDSGADNAWDIPRRGKWEMFDLLCFHQIGRLDRFGFLNAK